MGRRTLFWIFYHATAFAEALFQIAGLVTTRSIHPFACKGGIAQNSTDDYCNVGYTGIMCGVVSGERGLSLPA